MNKQEIIKRLTGMNDQIYHFALTLTRNEDKAKELRQNTFVKIFSNIDKFVEDINLEGWVAVIEKRIFLNDYEKVVLKQTLFDDENDISEINYIGKSDIGNPHEELVRKELEDRLSEVDPRLRQPLELIKDGYSYEEISDQMELNINTLKTRLRNGRKKYSGMIGYKRFTTLFLLLLNIWS